MLNRKGLVLFRSEHEASLYCLYFATLTNTTPLALMCIDLKINTHRGTHKDENKYRYR